MAVPQSLIDKEVLFVQNVVAAARDKGVEDINIIAAVSALRTRPDIRAALSADVKAGLLTAYEAVVSRTSLDGKGTKKPITI